MLLQLITSYNDKPTLMVYILPQGKKWRQEITYPISVLAIGKGISTTLVDIFDVQIYKRWCTS